MQFNFYGLQVKIEFREREIELQSICQDFLYFVSDDLLKSRVEISIVEKKEILPRGICFAKTAMCEVRQLGWFQRQLFYTHHERSVISVLDDERQGRRFLQIEVQDVRYLEEVLYFILNSVVGEYLDASGLMRIHAAALQINQQNYVFTGPCGSGKSTLADYLIRYSKSLIFSDEIALFDLKKKKILPYPIRRALNSNSMPSSGLSFFADKELKVIECQQMASPGVFGHLIHLQPSERTQLRSCSLTEKIGLFWQIFWGLGVIQMWEYLLRVSNIPLLCRIACNRLRLIAFLWTQETEVFERSGAPEDNLKTLESLLLNR